MIFPFMTKFILHGGATTVENDLNKSFFKKVVEDAPRDGTVLLVYFAREEKNWKKLQEQDEKSLREAAGNKSLRFSVATEEKFADQIDQSDVIYMRGGSTEKLIASIEKLQDFSARIQGKVVVGSSAGAYILSKFYYSNTDKTVHEGLAILPIFTICHYDGSTEQLKAEEDYKRLRAIKLRDCESVVL